MSRPSRTLKPMLRRAALLALAVSAAACSRTLNVPDFRGSPAFRSTSIMLDVRNLNYADVVVYGSRGGSWHRIGDVTGNDSETFEVPSQLTDASAAVRLRVHAIGSPSNADYVSDRITVSYGAVIQLRVAPVLRMTSWSVR